MPLEVIGLLESITVLYLAMWPLARERGGNLNGQKHHPLTVPLSKE